LTFVAVNLEGLAREATPEQAELIAGANEGVDRIAAVVRTLSGFARGDDGVQRAVDLRRALDGAILMAEPQIRGRARIVREFAEVPVVCVPNHRLEQVFLNLLLNAAQAIPAGDADRNHIVVRLARAADGVEVAVADTGVGIPDDVLGHIFEPFFTTKPDGSGTGLGLSISRGIVEELGGRIDVESEVGRGTTFRVSLPLAR
jgi:signal transduction histidine kinase